MNNYLDPEGLFVFDFNTEYKYQGDSGRYRPLQKTARNAALSGIIIMMKTERINEYELTLFMRDEEQRQTCIGDIRKTHFQRAYTLEEMQKYAYERAGIEICNCI